MTGYKSPPRRQTVQIHTKPRNAIRRCLLADYDLLGTWRAVGAKYGISSGMAYQVAIHGYRPATKAIRDRLPHAPAKPRIAYKPLFRLLWAAWLAHNKLTPPRQQD